MIKSPSYRGLYMWGQAPRGSYVFAGVGFLRVAVVIGERSCAQEFDEVEY